MFSTKKRDTTTNDTQRMHVQTVGGIVDVFSEIVDGEDRLSARCLVKNCRYGFGWKPLHLIGQLTETVVRHCSRHGVEVDGKGRAIAA